MSEQTNAAKINGKYAIITAIIGGIFLIISAIIGIFSIDISKANKTLIIQNTELSKKSNNWESSYNTLKGQFDELNNQNSFLSSEIEDLRNSIEDYSILVDENNSLKAEINELQNEIQILNDNINNQESETQNEPDSNITSTGKKVSIFDLDTFQGNAYWFKDTSFPFSEETDWLIDMYGNEFHSGYIAFHGEEKQAVDAIYNLDNKYSQCNIKIAWPRGGKNLVNAGAYIKFYADGELLDISPEIKCGDEPIEFSINLSGVKKFSFERIATGKSSTWMSVTIIYCYFDLIENET